MWILSSLCCLIEEITKQIIVLLSILMIVIAIMFKAGFIRRAFQRLTEHLLSKEINGALVTMADLEIKILTSEIFVKDLIIHHPQRDEWQWDSPVFAHFGRIHVKLNILSCIDWLSTYMKFPCKDIYSIQIDNVEIFIEKRQTIFNFHLLDASLDIPDPKIILKQNELTLIDENHTNYSSTNEKSNHLKQRKLSDENMDSSVEKKANQIVTSMLGAVSSLGRAANEGGKEGLEKALEKQKVGFVNKLKQFQERKEHQPKKLSSMSHNSHSSSMINLAKEVKQMGKAVGKAVEKNVSQIQEQIHLYKQTPPKKKDWIKKVNHDIFRIGFVNLTNVRIFSKDLIAGNTKHEKLPQNISNVHGWSPPIWLKSVIMTSSDFCPSNSLRNDQNLPIIGRTIDSIIDVFLKKMMTEIAKTNSGKVLRIAMGDVFNIIDMNKIHTTS